MVREFNSLIAGNFAPGIVERIGPRGENRLTADFVIVVQCPDDGRKGEIVPRDSIPIEQRHFFAFLAGRAIGGQQPCPVDELHLADARNVVDREQGVDFDIRRGFLEFSGEATFYPGPMVLLASSFWPFIVLLASAGLS